MPGFKHFRRFSRVARVVPGTNLVTVPFEIAGAVLVMLAVTLVLDGILGDRPILVLPYWLTVGSLEDAQSILSAILSTVSTVLALMFSVTLLVFSMASSQFGPRLMPHFLRDRTMQITLGLFLATFLHSLLTFAVAGQRGNQVFVPQLTVLTDIGLVLASFGYLIVYNNRVAQAIQTNNVIPKIVENLYAAISELVDSQSIVTSDVAPVPVGESVEALHDRCVAEGMPVLAVTSGYVQRIDHKRLLHAAGQREAIVCVTFRPGQFILEGEALAHVLPAARGAELAAPIRGAVMIGQHRTLEQDIEFAFAQLSEIAIRALSPAVNDTYTGLICIDWLGDALRMLVALPMSDEAWRTRRGEIRLLFPPVRVARIVPTAFDLIRQAGAGNPAVIIRLLQTYARLAPLLRSDDQRQALLDQAEAARETASLSPEVGLDRAALDAAYQLARERLTAGSGSAPGQTEDQAVSAGDAGRARTRAGTSARTGGE